LRPLGYPARTKEALRIVWSDPSLWATTVVWGHGLLDVGAAAGGSVDWTKVGPTTVIWGNLSP
jgi:hypothetical protein